MKQLIILATLSIAAQLWADEAIMKPTQALNLASYRDKNRVVIAFVPPRERSLGEKFRAAWANSAAEAKERDLRVFVIDNAAEQPELLRALKIAPDRFAVVLIGKDGQVANRTNEPVGPETIYSQIDSMPMRQQEMRERSRQ